MPDAKIKEVLIKSVKKRKSERLLVALHVISVSLMEIYKGGLMFRLANERDLPRILAIYEIARKFMSENGNPTQWGDGYPKEEMLRSDIKNGNLYVLVDDAQKIQAVFAFIIGEDDTYARIENGAWLSSSAYGTIHRIASGGEVPGVLAKSIEFCRTKCRHLRIDTHAANLPMQHLVTKCGFIKCGTIFTYDGTPRIAYELV